MKILVTWSLFWLLVMLPISVGHAEQVKVTVKGMVCSFCAQGIKKTLLRRGGVEKVDVDLDRKLVTITTTQGAVLNDAELKESITDAGYEVVAVERKPSS